VVRFAALRVGFLIWSVWLAVAALWLFVLPGTAHATFPGENGKIAYNGSCGPSPRTICTVNPDGSAEAFVTDGADPAWSPDGGKLTFWRDTNSSPGWHIYTANADGTDATDITNYQALEFHPTWSPDGNKIAFQSNRGGTQNVYVMNADGSGVVPLTSYQAPESAGQPVWSPDGSKIAFVHGDDTYLLSEVRTMNPDGSGVSAPLAQCPCSHGGVSATDWSPDSQKLLLMFTNLAAADIYVVNRDGSGLRNMTANDPPNIAQPFDGYASWSPDGTKIAFVSNRDGNADKLFLMDSDASNFTNLNRPATYTSWQALPPYSHPHPIGATPLRVSLVPAFTRCETTDANSGHGQPLDFPSCSDPQLTSSTTTIGPNSIGFARWVACPANSTSPFCNPASGVMPKPDLRITGSISDVKCASKLPPRQTACERRNDDYNPNVASGPYTDAGGGTGGAQPSCFPSATSDIACAAGADLTMITELPGASVGGAGTRFEGRGVRITDAYNGHSQTDSATMIDLGFPVPLDCIPTTDTNIGSACGVNTTANALAPGAVTAARGAVWELGEVELKDSGQDGVRGNSDDEVFATQGVFLP
jgi:hypothetical protein